MLPTNRRPAPREKPLSDLEKAFVRWKNCRAAISDKSEEFYELGVRSWELGVGSEELGSAMHALPDGDNS